MAEGRSAFASPGSPPRSELLWASSSSPGGALALADAEVSAAGRRIDWEALARTHHDKLIRWATAERRATSLLGPVTPASLGRYLGLPEMPTEQPSPSVMFSAVSAENAGD